ncbi:MULTISPECIES: hypothetical protein [Nostoc]|uniref:Uncharacterized protein n=1 Tax=Nostoc paludosum FACHB-159 TaxID=2692908 RepID=A0ABR8KA41_9NOSO|nr:MULTISPECIES: hypothetical protein [Nostoc]MBD2680105.1 hypothetical protein [Nostoc sp. FACHB-857]MBD2736363.1 hypothetical protein [Nostoc paludosum FACHB-159]
MKLVLTLVQWLLIGFAGLMCLSMLLSNQILPAIIIAISALILVPPLQTAIAAKLPSGLNSPVIRFVVFFILFFIGFNLGSPHLKTLDKFSLCTSLQQGVCPKNLTHFVENTSKLYLTTTPKNISENSPVELELKYFPEPKKEEVVSKIQTNLKLQNGNAQFELAPKNLPVGAYEVKLTIGNLIKNQAFSVWQSQAEAERRNSETLKQANTKVAKIILCNKEKDSGCQDDASVFPSGIKTIAAKVDVDSAAKDVGLKFTWNYLLTGNQKNEPANQSKVSNNKKEIASDVQQLNSKVGYFTYSISTGDRGFPPGNYELIVAPETNNAKPIRREFTIK